MAWAAGICSAVRIAQHENQPRQCSLASLRAALPGTCSTAVPICVFLSAWHGMCAVYSGGYGHRQRHHGGGNMFGGGGGGFGGAVARNRSLASAQTSSWTAIHSLLDATHPLAAMQAVVVVLLPRRVRRRGSRRARHQPSRRRAGDDRPGSIPAGRALLLGSAPQNRIVIRRDQSARHLPC